MGMYNTNVAAHDNRFLSMHINSSYNSGSVTAERLLNCSVSCGITGQSTYMFGHDKHSRNSKKTSLRPS